MNFNNLQNSQKIIYEAIYFNNLQNSQKIIYEAIY